mgnify:CR=1 FL=1
MKALIVVDMQNDFITGSLGTKEAQAIVPNVKKKIQKYVDHGDQIIFTRDTHDTGYLKTQEGKMLPVEHCIYPSNGWEIVDGIDIPHYPHINKHSFGWKLWNGLGFDFEEIELIGVCTDICVISNALILKAQFPEVKITVDASCCAGVTPELHESALKVIRSCQINVIGDEIDD